MILFNAALNRIGELASTIGSPSTLRYINLVNSTFIAKRLAVCNPNASDPTGKGSYGRWRNLFRTALVLVATPSGKEDGPSMAVRTRRPLRKMMRE